MEILKNNEKYKTLEERVKSFNKYCDSQPSCPCKFNNENCELKWLDSEATKTKEK